MDGRSNPVVGRIWSIMVKSGSGWSYPIVDGRTQSFTVGPSHTQSNSIVDGSGRSDLVVDGRISSKYGLVVFHNFCDIRRFKFNIEAFLITFL